MAEKLDWSGLFEEMKELGIKPEECRHSGYEIADELRRNRQFCTKRGARAGN